jgi:peptidoglycan/LPS O-acetylase OafA/YrhL
VGRALVAGGLIALLAVTQYSAGIPYPLIHNGLLSLPFLAIIYGIALRPRWAAILEWSPLRMLGEVSYSFFLTHGVVIALYFRPDGKDQQHAIAKSRCALPLRSFWPSPCIEESSSQCADGFSKVPHGK